MEHTGGVRGVFIITYKKEVPPIPVVGHVDCVPLTPWQVEQVEQVEEPAWPDHAPDDLKAQCHMEGADDKDRGHRAQRKRHKKRWGSSL